MFSGEITLFSLPHQHTEPLTARQGAAILGVTVRHFRRLAAQGKLGIEGQCRRRTRNVKRQATVARKRAELRKRGI